MTSRQLEQSMGKRPPERTRPGLVETILPANRTKESKIRANDLVEEIRKILAESTRNGKPLEEIRARFTPREQQVFESYVMCEGKTQVEVSADIGISTSCFSLHLRNILEIMSGRSRDERHRKKYEEMDEEELERKIRKLRKTSKTDLRQYNIQMYQVAKEKGIIDRVIPKKGPALALKILKSYEKLRKTKTHEEIVSVLRKREVKYLEFVIQNKSDPDSEYANANKISYNVFHRIQLKLLKKLRGDTTNDQLETLEKTQKICEHAGTEKLESWKKHLKPRELTVLEKRVLTKEPMTLEALGKEFGGISKEGVRQIEKRLLKKLEILSNGMTEETTKGRPTTAQQIRTLIDTRIANGEKLEKIMGRLTTEEKEILEKFALSDSVICRGGARSYGKEVSAALTQIKIKLTK